MKKQLLFFASLVMLNIANAQTSVHQSAYFSSTGSGGAGIVTNYMGGFANDKSRTFEAWVKRDTVDGDYHTIMYAPDWAYPSTRSILYMYLLGDSVYASYGSFSTGGYYAPDTNWHHISFETEPNAIHDTVITYDTLTGLTHITITISDSNTLYIDGVFAGSRKGSHTSTGSGAGTSIYIGCYWTTSGLSNYWNGHISRIAFYDTVLHAGSFTPDCVFDTTFFFSGGNISMPCIVLLPLNGDNNCYYEGGAPVLMGPRYTYETSPCAPTYTFYCPATDTIQYTGTDTVLKAVNTNASYMKGSNIALHKNGWIDPSTTSADYTTGVFTDTLAISLPNIYPYISSYRSDTEKVVVVVHDSVNSSFVPTINTKWGSVYPNPVQNVITINSPAMSGKIEITNLQGLDVFIQQFHSSVLQIDLTGLIQGIYILKINGAVIQKIVKE